MCTDFQNISLVLLGFVMVLLAIEPVLTMFRKNTPDKPTHLGHH